MTRILLAISSIFLLSALVCSPSSGATGNDAVKQIQVNDTKLTYLEQGIGEPVVCVHGAISDYRTWGAQTEALSNHYRVITYSRRYHHPNATVGDGSDYTRAVHTSDLAALLQTLKVGPAHLVGHSYGGAIAALVALKHPELVRSLVLGEPSLFTVLDTPADKLLLADQESKLDSVLQVARKGEAKTALRDYLRVVLEADVFDQLPPGARLVVTDNSATLGPMLTTFFEPVPFDCRSAASIKVPVLLVTGEFSPKFYRQITTRLHECFSDSKIVVLPGASHGLQMEKPSEFNDTVLNFFKERSVMVPSSQVTSSSSRVAT